MKHARKMVLVDINTLPPVTKDKNSNPLTTAVSALASSAEFNRAYYGANTISIAHLDHDMRQILERTDLDPSEKLKIYQEKLRRYLFLQRMSEKSAPTQPPNPPPSVASWLSGEEEEEEPEPVPPLIEPVEKKVTPVRTQSKHRSRLPRNTPIKETLRKEPKPKRLDSYFGDWETPKRGGRRGK